MDSFCARLRDGDNILFADLPQVQHRGRGDKTYNATCWCVSVHAWCLYSVAGILWIQFDVNGIREGNISIITCIRRKT